MSERLAVGETFTSVVVGRPAPAGSKTVRPLQGGRYAVRPSSKRTKPWMKVAAAVIAADWGDHPPLDEPVEVRLRFCYERPAGHRRSDGSLKPGSPHLPHKTGDDLDKLTRAALDALQGKGLPEGKTGALREDRRVVRLVAERVYDVPERAEIEMTRLALTAEEQEAVDLLAAQGELFEQPPVAVVWPRQPESAAL